MNPTTPNKPVTPATPDKPATPNTPATPGKPKPPAGPSVPATTDKPSTPKLKAHYVASDGMNFGTDEWALIRYCMKHGLSYYEVDHYPHSTPCHISDIH